MNNLHRELAPLSDAAWADLEDEVKQTFRRHIAGRRFVEMPEPRGYEFSSLTTGRVKETGTDVDGVRGRTRVVLPVIELRVPFSVDRDEVDSVARGAVDADWDPAKDAAMRLAKAEDNAVLSGSADSVGLSGIIAASPHKPIQLQPDIKDLTSAVAEAITALRLDGVAGPYNLLLSAELYTQLAESADEGNPVSAHIQRILGQGRVIWAPAIDGALVVSQRGGDYELHIGQDVSIGYASHDAEKVNLYLQETFTFRVASAEAAVHLAP